MRINIEEIGEAGFDLEEKLSQAWLEGILAGTTSRGSGDDIGLAKIYWSPAVAATIPAAPEACATVATAAPDPVHQGAAPATAENGELQDHGDEDEPCEPL